MGMGMGGGVFVEFMMEFLSSIPIFYVTINEQDKFMSHDIVKDIK